MTKDSDTPRGLKILCIDGGGVRGLSSLIILQEIMRWVENAKATGTIHPYEYFDLIAGTGTGGITACMLGRLQMSVDKAIAEYANLVKEVFKEKKINGPTVYKGTKLQEALKRVVRGATGNEEEMLNEGKESTGCKTVIFAMAKRNLNAGLPILFRSYSVATNPGPDCTIWEAVYATMAHPDLFKSIDIIESGVPQSFVGGELGCSNPLAHVLAEVDRSFPDCQISCILSIGAGHPRTIQVPQPSRWYRNQDVTVIKDMAADSERVAEEMAARFQRAKGVYFRFNVDHGMQSMKDGSWEKLGEAVQHTRSYLRKNETSQKLDELVHGCMKEPGGISTIQAAGQVSRTTEAPKRLIGFKRCPAPTKYYTGREDENAQVIACVTGGRNERRVCVVYGLGGVGKTQLVLNVIARTWDKWDQIIYVDASSPESIEKALKEFATAKSIGKEGSDVITWLESCEERWLMVFDNADTPTTNVLQYIPARGRGGSVLITTRLPDLATLAEGPDPVCHLSSMDHADGTDLLVKVASSRNQRLGDEDMDAVKELDFGGLALALVHAGAYIAHSPAMTVLRYRSLFLTQRQRMLEEYNQLPATAKLGDRGDTVYTTWMICYDQLKPESREFLWLIAYLHYYGISEGIFERAARYMQSKEYVLPLSDLESQAHQHVKQYLSRFLQPDGSWDAVAFTRVVADLTSYSLLEFDLTSLTYRVHVLVQDWAKTVIPHDTQLAIECTATLLSLSLSRGADARSLAFKRQLELHVTGLLGHYPNIGANHVFRFQEVYRYSGQWTSRARLLQQLLGIFRQEIGNDDVRTWLIRHEIASSYQELGRWEEAMHLQIEVLAAYKRFYGHEHTETLRSMNDLATHYSSLGQHAKAEQLGVQVLDAYRRLLGNEHPATLTSMHALAWTCARLGQYEKAKQLHVQALDAHKRVLGEEHPDTLNAINNLALTFSDMGQHEEAEKLGVQALDAYKRVLGEKHPDTLTAMSNLASTYSDLGRHDEAERLQTQVLHALRQVMGEEHPSILSSMNNLALTYSELGRHGEAERLKVQILDLCKRLLGDEHPLALTSLSNLASTYLDLGRPDKAEKLQVQVLDARKRILGEWHPSTLISMNILALAYSYLRRYGEAEQLQVQVLETRKRVLGEEHPNTLTTVIPGRRPVVLQDVVEVALR